MRRSLCIPKRHGVSPTTSPEGPLSSKLCRTRTRGLWHKGAERRRRGFSINCSTRPGRPRTTTGRSWRSSCNKSSSGNIRARPTAEGEQSSTSELNRFFNRFDSSPPPPPLHISPIQRPHPPSHLTPPDSTTYPPSTSSFHWIKWGWESRNAEGPDASRCSGIVRTRSDVLSYHLCLSKTKEMLLDRWRALAPAQYLL